ncbi:MAG: T9SS type A sorting domain-containing protein [Bacteroidales bacterium]|nr:T9SS type A sorting domain-containing protein [Bacteroidales bacterium]
MKNLIYVPVIILFNIIFYTEALYTNGLNWIYQIDQCRRVVFDIAVDTENNIYLHDTDTLYSISRHGRLNWKLNYTLFDDYGFIRAPVIDDNGCIYILTKDALKVIAIDREGNTKWVYFTEVSMDYLGQTNIAILSDGTLCIGQNRNLKKHDFVLLNPDGTLKKHAVIESAQKSGFSGLYLGQIRCDIFNHIVFDTGNYSPDSPVQHTICLLDSSLNVKWQKEYYCETIGVLSIGYAGEIFFKMDNKLSILDNLGNSITEKKFGIVHAPVIDCEGHFFIGYADTIFHFTDLGILKWKKAMTATISSPMILGSDNLIYFSCYDTTLKAVSSLNGDLMWEMKTHNLVVKSPTLDNEGNLICVDIKGNVYSVRSLSNGLDKNAIWPKVFRDIQNTGSTSYHKSPCDLSIPEKEVDYISLLNYPNPFSAETHIIFNLPGNARARLFLYDNQGRYIQSLLNQDLNQGIYNYMFDFSNFHSGLYILKFEANHICKTRKMLIIK